MFCCQKNFSCHSNIFCANQEFTVTIKTFLQCRRRSKNKKVRKNEWKNQLRESYLAGHKLALRVVYCQLRHAFGIGEHPIISYVPDDVEEAVENCRCRKYWNYCFLTVTLFPAN